MREILLTRDQVALVDDEDYAYLVKVKWCAMRSRTTWHAVRNITTAPHEHHIQLMHRAILQPSRRQQVDHIDGNGLNNQKSNLRTATQRENNRNKTRKTAGSSIYKGVKRCGHCKKRAVRIRSGAVGKDGRSAEQHLGYFYSERIAALVYDEAARSAFGEFACTNFKAISLREIRLATSRIKGKLL